MPHRPTRHARPCRRNHVPYRAGVSRRRLSHLAFAIGLALRAHPADATGLPRQDSLAAAIDQTLAAVLLARQLAPAIAVDAGAVNAAVEACRGLADPISDCGDAPLGPCVKELPPLYAALRDLQGVDAKPVVAGAAGQVAAMVADAAMRLGTAQDVIAAGACEPIAPAEAWPTRIALSPDGRSFVAEPVLPLRAGRRYALVVTGLPGVVATASSSAAAPVAAGSKAPARPAAAEAAIARMGTDATAAWRPADPDGSLPITPLEGLRVVLDAPLPPSALATLRVAFYPRSAAQRLGRKPLATVRVIDLRGDLRAARKRIAALPCAEVTATTFPSVSVAPGAARARRVLLSLPERAGVDTPLVIALHGLGDSAESFQRNLAPEAVKHGMAMLALELPGHEAGSTARPGELIDPARPAASGALIQQAAVDVMAAVHAARDCGLPLPGGARLKAAEPRYLGYSLGGITGAIARSVEPSLGTTVLVAPGGDLFPWLVAQLGAQLEFGATCIGGEKSGARCEKPSSCPEPGLCLPDPGFFALGDDVRVAYRRLLAPGDPAAYAGERTGPSASHAPLLVVTGGRDTVLPPLLATRLADAMGSHPVAPTRRHGPDVEVVTWPPLGHGLVSSPTVREQVFTFLASRGRKLLPVHGAAGHGGADEEGNGD